MVVVQCSLDMMWHTRVSLRTSLQTVAVKIHLKKYTVMSLYLPPSAQIVERDLLDLFQQLPSPFLVLGDFNGKHSAWGNIIRNHRGDMIASLIEHEDIFILNTGEPTHFYVQTGTFSMI